MKAIKFYYKPSPLLLVNGEYIKLTPEQLKEISTDCQDDYVEYLDIDYLKDKLSCGYMDISYNTELDILETIVTYSVRNGEKLSDEEIDELESYTSGQNSDGIGEGFEQYECCYIDDYGVLISPGSTLVRKEII